MGGPHDPGPKDPPTLIGLRKNRVRMYNNICLIYQKVSFAHFEGFHYYSGRVDRQTGWWVAGVIDSKDNTRLADSSHLSWNLDKTQIFSLKCKIFKYVCQP
jgi:hypothetical protein